MALGFEKLVNFNPFAGSGLLSIDFGSQQLKVLQFSASEPAQLIAAACVQTPPELAGDAAKRLEFQCSQLPAVIRNGGFKARRGVCAIPSSQMFCKHTQVLIDEGQTAKDAATIVASEQLGVDASQLAVRAVEIEGAHTAGGKREIVALATAQSLVERIMIAMRDAKVECVGLQSEFQAILSGFRPVNRRTQDNNITSLYLDIGAGSTKIVIGHGTKLAFAKAIGIGGRFFDQVAAQQARCTLPEGRAIRLGLNSLTRAAARPSAPTSETAGLAAIAAEMNRAGAAVATKPADAATAAQALASRAANTSIDLTDALRALTDEINLSVCYYQQLFPDRKIDRLIFVGGESRHAALCQHIARMFPFPAHASDPLARVARTGSEPCAGVDLSQPQPGWAVPLGLLLSPPDV